MLLCHLLIGHTASADALFCTSMIIRFVLHGVIQSMG